MRNDGPARPPEARQKLPGRGDRCRDDERSRPPSSIRGPLISLALVSVGFGALSPALSEVQEHFGVGAGLGSLVVAGLGAGRLLAGFPAGLLVDRVGPGRVVLGGTFVFVLGSLIGAAAPTFGLLVLGRVLQGIGLAVVPAGVLAQMMSGSRTGQAGGVMAVYQTAISVGGALGPAVGGLVAGQAGWRSALLFCAVAGLAALVVALPSRQASPLQRHRATAGQALGRGALLAVTLVMVPNAIASFDRFGVSQLALPLYAAGPGGLDATAVGLLLGSQTVIALAMIGPAGWATDRFGSGRVVAASAVLASAGIALITSAPGPLGLWAATLLFGVGVSALGVAGAVHVFTLPLQSTGTLIGVYRLSTDAVQVAGPLLVGPALEVIGYRATFVGMALFGLLALLALCARAPARVL